MDFIFDFFASIFQYPMMWFYNLTGNYLLALLLFTLLVKIIFIPFAIKQQKTQIKGAKLRPKIALIEKKYKGRKDPEAARQKQMEIMELQQKEGYSVFGGCFQLLLQLPVLLGIYRVVQKPFSYMLNVSQDLLRKICLVVTGNEVTDLNSVNQLTLIKQLSDKGIDISTITLTDANGNILEQITELPDTTLFGGAINLADTPNVTVFSWILLIPVLTFLFSYLSMKIIRKMNAPAMAAASTPETEMSNKIMEFTMPLMSVFVSFMVPAAVGCYWIFNSIFSILQSLVLAKLMPLPTYTEEEIRQYEKELKASHSRPQSAPRPAIRSRHHIDDDDYDAPPEKKDPQKNHAQNPGKNGGIQPSPVRDESDKNRNN